MTSKPNNLHHRPLTPGRIPDDVYPKLIDNMVLSAVDALLVDNEGRYILWKRKNEPLKDVLWMPWGRMQKGEKTPGTLVRILKDEVRVDISQIWGPIIKLDTYDMSHSHWPTNPDRFTDALSTVYVVKLSVGALLDLSDQHGKFGAYHGDAIPDCHPDLARVIQDHKYYLEHGKLPREISPEDLANI